VHTAPDNKHSGTLKVLDGLKTNKN
jgi:hypothetical protein